MTDKFANEVFYDKVYAERTRPWLAEVLKLLADGEWHDREDLVNQVQKMVPPGVAWRYIENSRIAQLQRSAKLKLTPEQYEKWMADPSNYQRNRPREDNDLIRRGQRGVVISSIGATDRIERRGKGKKMQLRRRPMSDRLLKSAAAQLRSFAQEH